MRDAARSSTWATVRAFFKNTVAPIGSSRTTVARVAVALRDLEASFLCTAQSDAWLERGRQLQHKFLKRARELGMTPVLPAFAGFVPSAMKARYPASAIHDSNGWGQFGKTHYIEPPDPLFRRVGAAFVKRVCAEYGCDDDGGAWFSADLYNELVPPSTEPAYLQNASAAVYAAMVDGVGAAAPPPKWLCQAWMWHSNTKSWGDPQRKAFLSGVP